MLIWDFTGYPAFPTVMDINQIREILPHRLVFSSFTCGFVIVFFFLILFLFLFFLLLMCLVITFGCGIVLQVSISFSG